MIRKTWLVWLTLALALVQAPARGSEERLPYSVLGSLDKPAEKPVIVKVSVLSERTGTFVSNLRAEDFILEENGERQKPTRFLYEERPLSVLLLLDSSGSMRPIIQPIIEGVSKGLSRLKPDDDVALLTFNIEVDILQD